MRDELKKKRDSLSEQDRQQRNQLIFAKSIVLPQILNATHIALYLPINNEVDTRPIINFCWQHSKTVYLPVLQKDFSLQFYSYAKQDALIENQWGILEPDRQTATLIDPKKLDCVIVPVVGFDANNNRIGMGAGGYDRTFAFRQHNQDKPFLIGLAFAIQKTTVHSETWDVPLDTIISA